MRNRTSALLTALLAVVAVLPAGCERAGASPGGASAADSTGEYSVRFESDGFAGSYVLTANGFPVERPPFTISARLGQEFAAFLTPALVSGPNTAAVEVTPFLQRSGDRVEAGPVRLRLWVEGPDGAAVPGTEASADSAFAAFEAALRSRWPRWRAAEDSALAADPARAAALADSAASDPRASAYGAGLALDSARAWAARHPVVVETAWARPGGAEPSDGEPWFDDVFREAAVIGGTARDSAALRAYAVRLRDLVADRDGAALYDEFAPALVDYAALAGEPAAPPDSARAGWVRDAAEGAWLFGAGDDLPDYTASDVKLRPWAGGRVWELYRDGADGLLQRRSGGTYTEVYVAEVDGALRVVR